MLSRKIRLFTIVLFALVAITFLLSHRVSEGISLTLLTLLSVYNLIRYGSINVALRHMKRNNLQKTKKYLNETIKVDWLSSAYKGYYYFIKAYVKTGEQDLDEAVKSYEKALDYGLRTENDEGIVYLQLALLGGIAGKVDVAKNLLSKAKELKIKSQLLEKIEKVEEILEKQKNSSENLILDYLGKIT